jgi:glycosyltransferase involved in cell wall biosynthesis
MAMGKPVIVSNCVPMKRITEETACGLAFQSGDVNSLKSALRTLLLNPTLRTTLGQNGRNAVLEKYNWDVDRKILLRVIESLPQGVRRGEMPALSGADL